MVSYTALRPYNHSLISHQKNSAEQIISGKIGLFPTPGSAILIVFQQHPELCQPGADLIRKFPQFLLAQITPQIDQQLYESGCLTTLLRRLSSQSEYGHLISEQILSFSDDTASYTCILRLVDGTHELEQVTQRSGGIESHRPYTG